MARRFFKRFIPDRQKVHADSSLKWLRPILDKPYLWHLNRHSVCKGLSMGMFWAWMPIPLQSIPAIVLTVRWRGNIAVSYAATWLSNPFTMIPHWWLAYHIGKWVMRLPPSDIEFTWEFFKDKITFDSTGWWLKNFWSFYWPMTVGSLFISLVAAVVSYAVVYVLWRLYAQWRWSKRDVRRARREKKRAMTRSLNVAAAQPSAPPKA